MIEVDDTPVRVMVEQLRSVDGSHLGRRVGHLSWEELVAVDRAARVLLGL